MSLDDTSTLEDLVPETDRKLFVGGLSWATTEDGLQRYFETYGVTVDRVTIIRDSVTGRSRGFGFVIFSDSSAFSAVLKRKHILDGRKLEVKRAIPKSDIPTKLRKVFVGGLPLSLTEEEFQSYFAKFGEIEECQIMTDRHTGNSRGFGFVSYLSDEAMQAVLAVPHQLDGKTVEVKVAKAKQQMSEVSQVIVPVPVFVPQFPFPGNSNNTNFASFPYTSVRGNSASSGSNNVPFWFVDPSSGMWVDNTGGLYGGVQAALLEGLQSRESAEKQTSQGVSQQQAQPQKVQLKQSHQGQGTPQQQQQQQQLQLQQSQQPAPVIPRPPQRAIPQQPKAKQLKLSQQQQSTTQHMKTSHPSQLQQQQQQQQSQSARTSPRVLAHGSQPEGVKPRTKKTLVQKKEDNRRTWAPQSGRKLRHNTRPPISLTAEDIAEILDETPKTNSDVQSGESPSSPHLLELAIGSSATTPIHPASMSPVFSSSPTSERSPTTSRSPSRSPVISLSPKISPPTSNRNSLSLEPLVNPIAAPPSPGSSYVTLPLSSSKISLVKPTSPRNAYRQTAEIAALKREKELRASMMLSGGVAGAGTEVDPTLSRKKRGVSSPPIRHLDLNWRSNAQSNEMSTIHKYFSSTLSYNASPNVPTISAYNPNTDTMEASKPPVISL